MSIKAEVTSDYASIKEVSEQAHEIHLKIQEYWRIHTKNLKEVTPESMSKLSDNIMGIIKNEFPQFYAAYALIIIYMIRGYYSKTAMNKYLTFIQKFPSDGNDEKYMDAVSRYVTWASVDRFPGGPNHTGWNKGQKKKFRKSIYESMIMESKRLKSAAKEAKEKIDNTPLVDDADKDELYNQLARGELQALSPCWMGANVHQSPSI